MRVNETQDIRVELRRLAARLASWDKVDALTKVAGLQLVPGNAQKILRLEAMAHAAMAAPETGDKPTLDRQGLRSLIRARVLSKGQIASAEDPFDSPFTESFSFFGGTYLVSAGLTEESPFVLRNLARALFFGRDKFPDDLYLSESHDLLRAVLALSDRMFRQAGFSRGSPLQGNADEVVIPASARLQQLQAAVTFGRNELATLLSGQGVSIAALEPLIFEGEPLSAYEVGEGPLVQKPIVRLGDNFVVLLPLELLSAATPAILSRAVVRGVSATLGKRYSDALWQSVTQSLRHMAHHRLQFQPRQGPDVECVREGLFTFDSDKVVHVVLISDPLTAYSVNASWNVEEDEGEIERRLIRSREVLCRLPQVPNEIFFLILLQGVGRRASFGVGDALAGQTGTLITAADLETIADLETDRLALWKFALAAETFREHTNVFVIGALNEFHLYRTHGHSYYLTDGARPDALSIAPGGAGELRREALAKRDRHGVSTPDGHGIVDVVALHDGSIPIYIDPNTTAEHIAVIVEGMPVLVWVIVENARYETLGSIPLDLANAVAYWIWQFSAGFRDRLSALAERAKCIVIRLEIVQDPAWELLAERGRWTGVDPLRINVLSEAVEIRVTVNPSLASELGGPDNRGERLLMSRLLGAIREVLPPEDQDLFTDSVRDGIIDRFAPVGPKKMLLLLNASENPDLLPGALPPYRPVQEFDENRILDEVGALLMARFGYTVGPIPRDERTDVLNKAVSLLFEELERAVRTIRPDGLIEWLLAHSEAIVRELALRRLSIPSQLACFSDEKGMIRRLTEEIPELSRAALASRFLIEYVAAQPPKGLRSMSLSLYDRLMSIASEITNVGFQSDLIRYELADTEMAILPSARLGRSREGFLKASASFLRQFSQAEIARAGREFPRYWPEGAGRSGAAPDEEVERATLSEFKLTLSDLLLLMREAIDLGSKVNRSVCRLLREELIQQLADGLGWPAAKVEIGLSVLSLTPRLSFMTVEPSFSKTDIYPWRFNRSLSYLRRPFIVRAGEDGRLEVLWGARHLFSSALYLMSLIFGGRLKARSTEMQEWIRRVNHTRGEAFNDRVADVFERDRRFIVRRRVKKVGNLRGPLGPPGDIDVLAADTVRCKIWVVECKDLSLARTPHELANEVVELIRGNDGRPSTVARQSGRARWVADHLVEVQAWLGLMRSSEWEVQPKIVVSQELFGPHLVSPEVPIVSLETLLREFATDIP